MNEEIRDGTPGIRNKKYPRRSPSARRRDGDDDDERRRGIGAVERIRNECAFLNQSIFTYSEISRPRRRDTAEKKTT